MDALKEPCSYCGEVGIDWMMWSTPENPDAIACYDCIQTFGEVEKALKNEGET